MQLQSKLHGLFTDTENQNQPQAFLGKKEEDSKDSPEAKDA